MTDQFPRVSKERIAEWQKDLGLQRGITYREQQERLALLLADRVDMEAALTDLRKDLSIAHQTVGDLETALGKSQSALFGALAINTADDITEATVAGLRAQLAAAEKRIGELEEKLRCALEQSKLKY